MTPQQAAATIQIVDPQQSPYIGPDNTSAGLRGLLEANAQWRHSPWPPPFDSTRHDCRVGDARDLSWLASDSVHLIVTSPPYWTLKNYAASNASQLGDIEDYRCFLEELDRAWRECYRLLVRGGRVCCVVGDVCMPRKRHGRHYIMPLHADIQVRAREVGFDCLTPILWHKIANGTTEAQGNGAGFYGKPYQPGAIIKNDTEYILFLRKPGDYRTPTELQKQLSMLTRDEMHAWQRSIWSDLPGASTRSGHPAPYPSELAERLIRLFSFAGDTILDPFAGTGTTAVAARRCGRNSISCDIEPEYVDLARKRLQTEIQEPRLFGATRSELCPIDF